VCPVEPRQGLHGLDAREPPVDVHAAEERLIEAGLELIGDQQDVVVGQLEGLADVPPVEVGV
jgi:hypothetical protein